jgi:hypothetical protein
MFTMTLTLPGYWMPYEAAKAVAATFCWKIRYALTPVFGLDFIDMCVPPDDARFQSMLIDPEITRSCAEKMQHYFDRELAYPSPRVGATITPGVGFRSPKLAAARPVPKKAVVVPGAPWKAVNRIDAPKDSGESEDETDSGDDDGYALSPIVSSPSGLAFKNVWGASPTSSRTTGLGDDMISPKTRTIPYGTRKRYEEPEEDDYELKYVGSKKRGSPKVREVHGLGLREMSIDRDYDNMEVDNQRGLQKGQVGLRNHGHTGNGGAGNFGHLDAAKILLDIKNSAQGSKRRASY